MKIECDSTWWVDVSLKDESIVLDGDNFRILFDDKGVYKKHFSQMVFDCIEYLDEKWKKKILKKLNDNFHAKDGGEDGR